MMKQANKNTHTQAAQPRKQARKDPPIYRHWRGGGFIYNHSPLNNFSSFLGIIPPYVFLYLNFYKLEL